MTFIVYIREGVVGFVCQELEKLLEYIGKNRYHAIEIWNENRRRAAHW